MRRRFLIGLLVVFVTTLCLEACTKQASVRYETTYKTAKHRDLVHLTSDTKMVEIKGGKYLPFYTTNKDSLNQVNSFLIDEHPVTNAQFLAFVKKNPQWRRSQIKSLYTDSTYLKDWVNDTTLPENALPDSPVCYVSWYAASAYAKAVGKRLPTMDEWEFMAMADETTSNARKKKEYSDAIVNLY